MPDARIINGRYSIILERDRNDPPRPPCNPCKCCKVPRNRAALLWAIPNLILSGAYFFLKVIDVLVWVGDIDLFSWGEDYHLYLESLYCTESFIASSASVTFDFVGQSAFTIGGSLFFTAVLSKNKEPRFRLRLSRWYLISICLTIIILITSKLLVIIADTQFDEHVICSPQTYRKTAIIIWSILMTVWLHFAASIVVSFMFWLETEIEEIDQADKVLEEQRQQRKQRLTSRKQQGKERQSMTSTKTDKDDAKSSLGGFSITDGIFSTQQV